MELKKDFKNRREYLMGRKNLINIINNKVGEITNSGLRENSKKMEDSPIKKEFRKYCNMIIGHQEKSLDDLSSDELISFYNEVLDFYDCYLKLKIIYDQFVINKKTNDKKLIEKITFEIGNNFYLGRCQNKKILWKVIDLKDKKCLIISQNSLYNFEFPKHVPSEMLIGKYEEYCDKIESYLNKINSQIKNELNESIKLNENRMFLLSTSEVLEYFPNKRDRIAKSITEDKEVDWLLSDILKKSRTTICVSKKGEIKEKLITNNKFSIRPALWIDEFLLLGANVERVIE